MLATSLIMEEGNCSIFGLNGIRNDYRSNATNMLQKLKQLLDTSDIDESRIKNTIELLKQMKNNIAKCDDTIQVLLDEDAFIRDMEESAKLNEDIEKDISRAESLLDILGNEALEAKFRGETVDWFRFWEAFQSEIQQDKEFSQGFKFACLKHRLEGWPLNMISKLGSGDSAYNEALKLLQTTFSNKKVLVESHLSALLDIEAPTATPASLMRFTSEFEYHVRALKAYETNIEEAGFFVAAFLNKKLPIEIWSRVNKADRASYWTLPEFQNALKSEIQLLNFECSQQVNNVSEERPPGDVESSGGLSVRDDSACKNETEGARGFQDSSKYSLTCQLCSGRHHFSGCTIYKTPFQKKERSQQLELCLICVNRDHSTEKCLKSICCTNCNGKHNTLLCLTGELSKDRNNGGNVMKKKESEVNPLKDVQQNIVCPLCDGNHQFGVCNKFDTPIKKHGRAVILNLCTLCLKGNHKAADCLKNSFCKNCGEKHNTLLCLYSAYAETKKPKEKRKRNRVKKKKQAANIPNGNVAQYPQGIKKSTENVQIGNMKLFKTNEISTNTFIPLRIGDMRSFKPNVKNSSTLIPPYQGNSHSSTTQIKTTKFPTQDNKTNTNKVSVTCALCLGNHLFVDCGKYKTAVEKRVRAVQLKLCLLCVNNKHSTSACLKLQVCKFCKARHHTLLCVESQQPTKEVDEEEAEKRRLKRKAKKERRKLEKENAVKCSDPIGNLVMKTKENKQENGNVLKCNSLLTSFIKTSGI